MEKNLDESINEKRKEEKEKLKAELFDGLDLSDAESDPEDGVDEDDYLDIDAELLRDSEEDFWEDSTVDDFVHSEFTKNIDLKAIADENDYEETKVLPALTKEAIEQVKAEKTVSENKPRKKKKKKVVKPASDGSALTGAATAAAVSAGAAVVTDAASEKVEKPSSKKNVKKNTSKSITESTKNNKKPVEKKTDEKKQTKNKSVEKKPVKKEKKKSKLPLILGILFAVIVIGCVGTYVGFAKYFETHYFYNTTINGKDFSMLTVDDAKAYMAEKVLSYELVIEESDGSSEKISGDQIGIKFASEDELQKILEDQNEWRCFECLSHPTDVTTSMSVTYDKDKLDQTLSTLKCMDDDSMIPSENAYPDFDEEKGEYVVHPEVTGTEINKDTFKEKVEEAILSFTDTINVEEAGCYIPPKYTVESETLQKCCKKLNKYLKAEITYDVYPETEIVDASVIKDWVSYTKKYKVKFDEDAVWNYVENLASNYNTVGMTRTFTSGSGASATVSGGVYGFAIDKETEYNALLENIKNGDVVTREPYYSQRGIDHSNQDFGSTFAEVDLTNQCMYYVENGETIMSSDVVTGIPNNGHATPEGVYQVSWKQSPSTLKGRNDDGSKYAAKVQYWMAFNYDIGFHDANWQSSFGGQRYLSVGSHGCVNMPTDKAGELYKLLDNGTPVIVHW